MKRVSILTLVGALSPALALPPAAAAKQRSPVIGCIPSNNYVAGRVNWQSKPWNCTTGGSLGSGEGIWHVRWSGWGRRTATGRGQLVDGLGFMYPAQITAFRRRRIPGHDRTSYTRLHVIAQSRVYVIPRGPFNVFIDVTPE